MKTEKIKKLSLCTNQKSFLVSPVNDMGKWGSRYQSLIQEFHRILPNLQTVSTLRKTAISDCLRVSIAVTKCHDHKQHGEERVYFRLAVSHHSPSQKKSR